MEVSECKPRPEDVFLVDSKLSLPLCSGFLKFLLAQCRITKFSQKFKCKCKLSYHKSLSVMM